MSELRAVAESVSASLEFVRPVSLARRPVDARELVEESLRTATKRVPFAGAIERRYAPDLPELHADPELLRGVVTNLIVNAFEAMNGAAAACAARALHPHPGVGARRALGEGRRRRPRGCAGRASPARARDHACRIRGPAIAEELREKIFYPFFTTKERGSGVGLALAQKIVASHGGVLELESVRGAGATFRVRLPVPGGDAP